MERTMSYEFRPCSRCVGARDLCQSCSHNKITILMLDAATPKAFVSIEHHPRVVALRDALAEAIRAVPPGAASQRMLELAAFIGPGAPAESIAMLPLGIEYRRPPDHVAKVIEEFHIPAAGDDVDCSTCAGTGEIAMLQPCMECRGTGKRA
jgi:hypothetical protein